MSTKAIALALGLNEAATETACLSALTDLRGKADNPDPARFVKKDLHDQTLATLSATTQKLTETTSQLDAIKVAARKGDVETVIEGALKAKKIVPAQRDSLVAQCSSDEGFAQVKAFPRGIAEQPAGHWSRSCPARLRRCRGTRPGRARRRRRQGAGGSSRRRPPHQRRRSHDHRGATDGQLRPSNCARIGAEEETHGSVLSSKAASPPPSSPATGW